MYNKTPYKRRRNWFRHEEWDEHNLFAKPHCQPWSAESRSDANNVKVVSPPSTAISSSSLQDFNDWLGTCLMESKPACGSWTAQLSKDVLLLEELRVFSVVPSRPSASECSTSCLISSRRSAALGRLWILLPSYKSLASENFDTEFPRRGEMFEVDCLFL